MHSISVLSLFCLAIDHERFADVWHLRLGLFSSTSTLADDLSRLISS
jgi:hypothetical protein